MTEVVDAAGIGVPTEVIVA